MHLQSDGIVERVNRTSGMYLSLDRETFTAILDSVSFGCVRNDGAHSGNIATWEGDETIL